MNSRENAWVQASANRFKRTATQRKHAVTECLLSYLQALIRLRGRPHDPDLEFVARLMGRL